MDPVVAPILGLGGSSGVSGNKSLLWCTFRQCLVYCRVLLVVVSLVIMGLQEETDEMAFEEREDYEEKEDCQAHKVTPESVA